MLAGQAILIVEDQAVTALDLAEAVEHAGGKVVGPVASVIEALRYFHLGTAHAAIIDVGLSDRDVTPLVVELLKQRAPFVIYTGGLLPTDLSNLNSQLAVVGKPAPAQIVIEELFKQIYGSI